MTPLAWHCSPPISFPSSSSSPITMVVLHSCSTGGGPLVQEEDEEGEGNWSLMNCSEQCGIGRGGGGIPAASSAAKTTASLFVAPFCSSSSSIKIELFCSIPLVVCYSSGECVWKMLKMMNWAIARGFLHGYPAPSRDKGRNGRNFRIPNNFSLLGFCGRVRGDYLFIIFHPSHSSNHPNIVSVLLTARNISSSGG